MIMHYMVYNVLLVVESETRRACIIHGTVRAKSVAELWGDMYMGTYS